MLSLMYSDGLGINDMHQARLQEPAGSEWLQLASRRTLVGGISPVKVAIPRTCNSHMSGTGGVPAPGMQCRANLALICRRIGSRPRHNDQLTGLVSAEDYARTFMGADKPDDWDAYDI